MAEKHGEPLRVPSYSVSAPLYDRMVGIYAFEHWKENFERLEEAYGLKLARVADAACGTGLAASYLAERGAEVWGFDLSPYMLREAVKGGAGRRARFVRQDMRYLQPPRRVSLLICATDSLNHLLREEDIRRALASFRAALLPGGHALFDLNTAWQLREGSDAEAWDFEVGGLPMRWESRWDEAAKTHTLTITFPGARGGGGGVVEKHRERAYGSAWLLEELARAGFSRAEVMDAAGLGPPHERTRRLQFVARA